MKISDVQICTTWKADKMKGMELLFHVYYKPLVAWASTFLHDMNKSEDLVQEFFVKLWEKSLLDILRPDTMKSYLFTSIRNLSLNASKLVDPLAHSFDVALNETPWDEYDDFEEEVFARVEIAMENLPTRCKEVLRCVYLKGMKYREVADVLGISVATVNSLLVVGLKKIRQQIGYEDFFCLYLFFLEKNRILAQ